MRNHIKNFFIQNLKVNYFLNKFLYFRFFLIGIFCSSFHYCFSILIFKIFGLNEIISNSMGFTIAAFISYVLNSKYTFKIGITIKVLIKYFIVLLCGLILSNLLTTLLVYKQINFNIILIFVIIITSIFHYVLHKYFTFKVYLKI